jgi:hypothetical protein
MIAAHFRSPLNRAGKNPKKKVVQLNPIFASLTPPAAFFRRTCIGIISYKSVPTEHIIGILW